MKRIYLLRHAKAESAESFPDRDIDRPLSDRGQHDAVRVGRYAVVNRWVPDRILCSGALRARQTAEALTGAWNRAPPIEADPALFQAGPLDLLEYLKSLPETGASFLLVGHNPSIQEVAVLLAGTGAPETYARMRAKFPPAALAVLDPDIPNWSGLAPGCAELSAFIRGAELA